MDTSCTLYHVNVTGRWSTIDPVDPTTGATCAEFAPHDDDMWCDACISMRLAFDEAI